MAKAKSKAKNISASDIPENQKIKEIQKLYKGALKNKTKRSKVYVAGITLSQFYVSSFIPFYLYANKE